jgi:hypothetical protein
VSEQHKTYRFAALTHCPLLSLHQLKNNWHKDVKTSWLFMEILAFSQNYATNSISSRTLILSLNVKKTENVRFLG